LYWGASTPTTPGHLKPGQESGAADGADESGCSVVQDADGSAQPLSCLGFFVGTATVTI
jgi:hypothetical protein